MGNCLEQLDYPSNDKLYFVDYSPVIDRKSTIIGEFIVQSNKDEEFDTKKFQAIKALAESIALYQLIALAKMRPDCIWDGD